LIFQWVQRTKMDLQQGPRNLQASHRTKGLFD
jgi:hypothetical protein